MHGSCEEIRLDWQSVCDLVSYRIIFMVYDLIRLIDLVDKFVEVK